MQGGERGANFYISRWDERDIARSSLFYEKARNKNNSVDFLKVPKAITLKTELWYNIPICQVLFE
jgi:hypothetical protein